MFSKLGRAGILQSLKLGRSLKSTELSFCLRFPFCRPKPFPLSRSVDEIWKALDVKMHIPASMRDSPQEVKQKHLIGLLSMTHQKLTEKIEQLMIQIQQKKQQLAKAFQETTITVEELLEQYQQTLGKIHKLTEGIQISSEGQLVERINLEEGIISLLAEKDILPKLHNKYIHAHVGYAFYIQTCCKIRDSLDLIASFKEGTSLHQLHPSLQPDLWNKVTLVDVPVGSRSKEYIECQLLMHIIGGATAAAKKQQQSNSLSIQFFGGAHEGWLQYKSLPIEECRDTLQRQINLIDYGIFKTINQGMCPSISTNSMIYIPFQSELDQSSDIFSPKDNAIPVRILHSDKLLKRNEESDQPDIQDVVIHMHGGGYVAMSSNGTQIYTREWANTAKVPIFSIDYRLAPQHPFPEPIEDCLRAYDFITKHIHKHYRVSPKNIYLGGDSGGGNLTCALTTLILKKGLTKPKGLHLVYPSLDSRLIFYGSRKYTFNDPVLWPSLIKIAYRSYFPDKSKLTEPLASPFLLTQGYFTGNQNEKEFPTDWPTIYMEVGTHDTLRDDCFLFLNRLNQANIKSKLFVLKDIRHGYLNMQSIIPSSKGVCYQSSLILKELIEETKKEF